MKAFIRRHPVSTYFFIVFLISWGSGLVLLGPKLAQGESIPVLDGLLLFPILVLGVALTGLILTGIVDGRDGVRDLFSRIGRWRVSVRWYAAALLIPPSLILVVLLSLSRLVSPLYTPGFFLLGILFGVVPGFLEEIGWMGYAFPKMRSKQNALSAGIVLGVLWGLWHLPVVDSLGAASPHKAYWLPYFLAFIALVTAMRILIVWIYSNTESLLLAQLMHASSTASLVIFSPAHISPGGEAYWYAVYALVLWVLVAIISARYGTDLVRRPKQLKTV